ncbi:MAG: hypothetical protein AB7V19_07340, partial [Candidatus Bipolaricaulia bacterium]
MKRVLVLGVLVLGLLVTGISVSAATQAWIPGVASLAIPGLGQLLNGQEDKALVHFVVGLGISALGYGIGWYVLPGAWYLVPTLYFAWSVYSACDAYNVA